MSTQSQSTGTIEELRARIEQLAHIRKGFAAHLGESLYEATKDMPEMWSGREHLYDAMALCDAESARMLKLIARLEAYDEAAEADEQEAIDELVEDQLETADDEEVAEEEETSEPALEVDELAQTQVLPTCEPLPEAEQGAPLESDDTVDEQAPLRCPVCGSEVGPSHKFCVTCGHKLVG